MRARDAQVPASPVKIIQPDIVRVAQQLPASPRILSRLSAVLRDMNTGVDDVVSLVKADPGITSGVIRLSNSALFAFSQPSTSLDEAINRVGFREVYRLVGLASTNQLFPKKLDLYGVTGDLMWENAVATALAMEALAKKNFDLDDRVAYTIGLLRSAGKIILSRLAAKPGSAPPYPGEEEAPYLAEWEKTHLGMDSNEACARVMQHWKFSRTIVEAIRHHYAPLDAPSAPVEAFMLNIAGWIAQTAGKGIPGETLYWRRHPDKFMQARISPEIAEELVGVVQAGFEKLRGVISPAEV